MIIRCSLPTSDYLHESGKTANLQHQTGMDLSMILVWCAWLYLCEVTSWPNFHTAKFKFRKYYFSVWRQNRQLVGLSIFRPYSSDYCYCECLSHNRYRYRCTYVLHTTASWPVRSHSREAGKCTLSWCHTHWCYRDGVGQTRDQGNMGCLQSEYNIWVGSTRLPCALNSN